MKRLKGFTLVELVIVIAIVIILSVVSVPIYRGYTRNAKMSEGYALLGLIMSAQKAYYSQYGNFLFYGNSSARGAKWTNNDTVLGIDARGNKYFTRFNIGAIDDQDVKEFIRFGVAKPEDLRTNENRTVMGYYYNVTTGATFKDDTEL